MDDTGADFRVLGPVEVLDRRSGAYVVPSGAKQRALLGALVVRVGQVLPADRLIHELWGDRPPAGAANALHAHVARLRRLLQGAGGQEWIATRSMGYLLHPGRATTDAQRFHRLSAEGRAALGADPVHAAQLLSGALALWRGPALEGSGQGPLCTAEADRLEELRLTTLETLYDANLRSGRHAEVARELERLTAGHPTRERLYDLQMLALYRCGRQAEALGVYERPAGGWWTDSAWSRALPCASGWRRSCTTRPPWPCPPPPRRNPSRPCTNWAVRSPVSATGSRHWAGSRRP